MLEQRGHSVARVSSGQEAVEILTHETFDVVLLDVRMPEMDGLEVPAAIRAMEHQSAMTAIRIVAIAAGCLTGDRERYLAAGRRLHRVIYPGELFDVVENLSIIRELAPETRSTAQCSTTIQNF